MDQKAFFMKFWEKEAAATREVIARIPARSDYKPDPKSRTAREIVKSPGRHVDQHTANKRSPLASTLH